jgi:hypothetical protein
MSERRPLVALRPEREREAAPAELCGRRLPSFWAADREHG